MQSSSEEMNQVIDTVKYKNGIKANVVDVGLDYNKNHCLTYDVPLATPRVRASEVESKSLYGTT